MGVVMRSCLSFLLGATCGVYFAQNYNVPNLRKLSNTGMLIAKHYEETYRKPPPANTEHVDQQQQEKEKAT